AWDDRYDPASTQVAQECPVHPRHVANPAKVERSAVIAGQGQALAEETLQRSTAEADGSAAELTNLRLEIGVDFVKDAEDDGERVIIGVAAALHLAWLESRAGHGSVDGLAAAMDQERAHADRFHED